MNDPAGPQSRRLRAAQLRDLIRKAEEELRRIGEIDFRPAREAPAPVRAKDPAKIRAWAATQGIVVGRTGRIRYDVLEDYAEAHPEEVTR